MVEVSSKTGRSLNVTFVNPNAVTHLEWLATRSVNRIYRSVKPQPFHIGSSASSHMTRNLLRTNSHGLIPKSIRNQPVTATRRVIISKLVRGGLVRRVVAFCTGRLGPMTTAFLIFFITDAPIRIPSTLECAVYGLPSACGSRLPGVSLTTPIAFCWSPNP